MAKRLQDIRAANQSVVLELLRHHPWLTRTQIVELSGLTTPTVSAILRELQERTLIRAVDRTVTTGGRRAEAFRLNGEDHRVLAVHVGVQSLTAAVIDISGKAIEQHSFCRGYLGKEGKFINRVYEVVRDMIDKYEGKNSPLRGIGISFPGVVDEQSRVVLAPNIGGEGESLLEPLKTIPLPVYIDNDARLGALGQVWWSPEVAGPTVVFIMADYGVGAGMVIDGKVHCGKNSAAGDIGHAVIDPRGRRCDCGQFGCLETFVSFPALVRKINAEARLGRPTVLLPAGASEPLIETLDEIVDAALAGDELAKEAIEEAGRYLAIAVSMLNVTVAPDVVYFGGTLSRAYELFIAPMNEMLHRRGPELHRKGLRIEPAIFREDTSLFGAAAMVYHNLLSQDESPPRPGINTANYQVQVG